MPNKSFISDYNQFEMQITTEMQINCRIGLWRNGNCLKGNEMPLN